MYKDVSLHLCYLYIWRYSRTYAGLQEAIHLIETAEQVLKSSPASETIEELALVPNDGMYSSVSYAIVTDLQ